MQRDKVLSILNAHQAELKNLGVRSLEIFGSVARDDARPDSDIDFFIISEIPDDKIADVSIVNAMLVRTYGAIESISTVPAIRAEDAIPQMKKAKEMAAAMVYASPVS